MTYSKVQGVRNEIAEAHNALRLAIIYFVVTVIALVVEIYLAVQSGAWQMVAVAGVGTGLMVAAGWSVRLIRQGRHRFGIRLLIGASLLSVLTAPFFIVGFGLMLGLGTMLIVLTVASQTLPVKETNLWLVGSVLIAIVAGGIDLSVDYFVFTALDVNSRLNEPTFQTMIAVLGG
ncbi:MAG: hypothetical protein R3264_16300, partial [Anaerolineae bacterium]|nr:hypothetical protein [Anaerolineae bacterium]